MRHPFETWPTSGRRAWIWSLVAALLATTTALQVVGRELAEGGLVGLQMARTHERVGEIISAWQADGVLGYGAFSLGIDMAFPVVYALLLSVAAAAVAHRARERGSLRLATTGAGLAWLAWVAGLLDLVENVLQVPYFRNPSGSVPAVVATLATVKFACLVVVITGLLWGWTANRTGARAMPAA